MKVSPVKKDISQIVRNSDTLLVNDAVREILVKYWGFENFREPQEAIIQQVLTRQDTVALLPTGGGKSICYQVPALVFPGKTIVVSPLIALMEDQVQALKKKGIKADCIHSQLSFRDIDRILDNFVHGDIKLLYISPERIETDIFKERFIKAKVDLVAIDEAHCISQWGFDFRPSYLQIVNLRQLKPSVVFMALTATATPEVLTDLQRELGLVKPTLFRKSFVRENLRFYVVETIDKYAELFNIVTKIQQTGIIYVRNRGESVEIARWLQARKIPALPYHGGMDKYARDNNQKAWMDNKVRIMVATNAFGMGIDKPDVRVVIHLDIPSGMEEYYQEAGRGGRDGKESMAVILFDKGDVDNAFKKWEENYPDISQMAELYDQLCRYYKVAYGSGNNETYPFDLPGFASAIKKPVKTVFIILSMLEREGWIYLSDSFRSPTKLQIVCEHQELYEPGFLNKEQEELIVFILRRYEGLFIQPVSIDENVLANGLGWTQEKVISVLKSADKAGILTIQFRKTSNSVTFTRERPDIKNFFIDKKRYQFLKERALERLTYMVNYTNNQATCRQKLILQYFGEKYATCGKCDVCTFSNTRESILHMAGEIEKKLVEASKTYRMLTIKEILFHYPYQSRMTVKRAIQIMEEEGKITVYDNGRVKLN